MLNQRIKQISSTDYMSQRGPRKTRAAYHHQMAYHSRQCQRLRLPTKLKLNPNKASVPDLLKEMVIEIGPFLTIIFQKSFDTGIVPKDWRTANVTAIFKKGWKYKASNYRPVSLTSLC